MKFPRIPLNLGDRFWTIMPYSEVCLHMKIAGKEMIVQVLNHTSAVGKICGFGEDLPYFPRL